MNTDTQILVYVDQAQAEYDLRQQGQWLVVPVVMMTPGVRHGSAGPVLHLAEHYSDNPEAWNGIPVTAGHPETADGDQISVNSVSQDQWVVGHLRNTRVEGGKLKADVYINQQRAIAVNPEVLNYLNEGRQLEVSIGAFTRDQPEAGQYQNTEYQAVTLSYFPDHLALLPGETGACSWADGCGIRNNKQNSHDMKDFKSLKEQIKEGKGVADRLQDNQVGFMELTSKIQTKLDRMDSDIRLHFLQEVFDEFFIYKVRNRDTGEDSFYRLEYNLTDDEEVEFIGEPREVRKEVEFVPMQSNETDCDKMKRTKKPNVNKSNEDTMSDKKTDQPSGEVMEKVVGLVNNERTHFSKSDRSWLLQLNTDQLEKLEPKEAENPEVTREDAIQTLSEDLTDIDKVKELVSEDVKGKIELGLKSYNDVREKLVKSIQTNTSEEDWPTETLQEMSTQNLQRLAKSVRKVDYSGQAPVVNGANGEEQEEMLLPAGIELE